MADEIIQPGRLLELMKQQRPFRYLDEVRIVNDDEFFGAYTFREDEPFYEGHFPGSPITPGVVLVEAMGQLGIAVMGLYSLSKEVGADDLDKWDVFLVDVEAEFIKGVAPGERVEMEAKRLMWRRNKIKSQVNMYNAKRELVSTVTLSGMGVRNG